MAVVPMILALHAEEALAQQPSPPAVGASVPAAAPPADGDKDGVRFRGGVSATAGTMFISDYSGFLAGVDGRLGVQINDLIGVYAVPHLTFGPISVGPLSTVIGVFSATAVADVTLLDQIFIGGGGGFGIVNNPSGPVAHFRFGGYPLMGHGDDGIRRKGLMVGADIRLYFLQSAGVGITVMQAMGGIGYEAF
jgi:hypothetical protein